MMVSGQMPLVQRSIRRVLYWGDPEAKFSLTTKDDTAAFTAAAALDPDAPRNLHVAGSEVSVRDIAALASETSGKPFKLFRAGSLDELARLIKIARWLAPQKKAIFPPWQGCSTCTA